MDAITINNIFLIGTSLIALSVLLTSFSSRVGVPILLVFLGVGMLAGEDGPGGILFSDYSRAYLVGNLALAVIMFDGGMRTHVSTFRVALWPAFSLATFGVLLTVILTGVVAMWLFNLPWLEGLLIGAIVGSTDAAAVFSLLGSRNINERVRATLEIESGSNDPMAIFLTVTLIALIAQGGSPRVGQIFYGLVSQFGIGIFGGFLGGWIIKEILNRTDLPTGLYPLLALSSGLLTFAACNHFGGSGILAIYLTGLFLGNQQIRGRHSIRSVLDGLTWLSQISMFVVLGLLVTPSDLLKIALPALVLSLWLIIVARPVAVWLSLLPFRYFADRERCFISWVGLRGAVPIILATFPMMANLANAHLFFNVAFFVVLMSLLLQGMTLKQAMNRAAVELPPKPHPIARNGVDIYPGSDWEIFIYQLTDKKWCLNVPLRNLKMPPRTHVIALFRGLELLYPDADTRLQAFDRIAIMARPNVLNALNELFSQAPEPELTQHFFGDLVLDGAIYLPSLSKLYQLDPQMVPEQTLAEFLLERLGGTTVVGDRLEWQGWIWTVAEMSDGQITRVGVIAECPLEPEIVVPPPEGEGATKES